MRAFDFSTKRQYWDRYRKFHTIQGPFVLFDDGGCALVREPTPDQRRNYPDLALQPAASTDDDLPPLCLSAEDTDPIPRAWISQGGLQHLIIDHERGRAYRPASAAWGRSVSRDAVPECVVRQALMYWAGPKRNPFCARGIEVSKPNRKLAAKLKPKLEDVRAAVTAAKRLSPEPTSRWPAHYSYNQTDNRACAPAEWETMSVEEIVADVLKNESLRDKIATYGFRPYRDTFAVPCLHLKG